MNLATKYNMEIPVRVADLPLVLTLVNVEERSVKLNDTENVLADVLIATDPAGTRRTVRLNEVTATQLVRFVGPDTDAYAGKQILATTYEKGDRKYISFAPAPQPIPEAPKRLPATGKNLPEPASPEPDAIYHKPRTSRRSN